METRNFLQPEFYKNPELTLKVLNELIQQKQVEDKEMYEKGTFLYMGVYDNKRSRSILSQVISDFDAYKEYNDECSLFKSSEQLIVLCALHEEHRCFFKYFDGCKEIKYNHETGLFLFEEDMPPRVE